MYECHITIEPVFDDQLNHVKSLAEQHGFRVADLLMKKREHDTPERSSYDTFMTGYATDYLDMVKSMRTLIQHLHECSYRVWRYKIEDIVIDSRTNDIFGLLIK